MLAVVVFRIGKFLIYSHEKVLHFGIVCVLNSSVTVALIEKIYSVNIAFVCRFFEPIFRFSSVIFFRKIPTSKPIHGVNISVFCFKTKSNHAVLGLSWSFIIDIKRSANRHIGEHICGRFDYKIPKRFEFFVFFNRNFGRHLIRISPKGFALKPIPQLVKFSNLLVFCNGFYDIIYDIFILFREISIYLFALVFRQSFRKILKHHHQFGRDFHRIIEQIVRNSDDSSAEFLLQRVTCFGLFLVDVVFFITKYIVRNGLLNVGNTQL